MTASPRRVIFLANDGLGAGHVTRSIAVMKALGARLSQARVPAALLLATTSEADALLRTTQVSALRLPSTSAARRQGLPLSAYRKLIEGILLGLFDGFPPDLLVVDTFPAGPHLELSAVVERAPLRALIQRSVAEESSRKPEMTTARGLYHLTLAPGDPAPQTPLWRAMKITPPILLASPRLSREKARDSLGLGPQERVALLNPGGGGDPDALLFAERLRPSIEARGYRTLLAAGPLAHEHPALQRLCPLAPYLAAFDVAFSAAGYNSAHELAEARVPTALFPRPRAFDDQRARALRFQKARLALVLDSDDPAAISATLDQLETMTPPGLTANGAEIAAEHLARLLGLER